MGEHRTEHQPTSIGAREAALARASCRRLLLARHGTAEGNDRGVRLGFWAPLAPRGEEQAGALARRVRDLDVTEVWSSPSPRAWRTAEIVARELGLPVRPEPDLREIEEGPWEGLTEEEIARSFPREHALWQRDPGAVHLPGREGLREARHRVTGALERLLARPGTALGVTHSGPIRLAWVHFNGLPLDSFGVLQPSNGGLFCLRSLEDGWELAEVNGEGG